LDYLIFFFLNDFQYDEIESFQYELFLNELLPESHEFDHFGEDSPTNPISF